MTANEFPTERFEADRARLRGLAYRMLGSVAEAEDAVQEAWIRLNRAGADGVDNLSGWLTTVVARICLDMLRARRSRREEMVGAHVPDAVGGADPGIDPEQEAMLADSVGLALLVVLDRLPPAERVAFVLHDMFDIGFGEIAANVGRSPLATRQLASRARRRVRSGDRPAKAGREHRQEVVSAFLAASHDGDFEALLALLDPEVVFRADLAAARMGGPAELRGAAAVAQAFKGRARAAQVGLVDGAPGLIVAPKGRLMLVLAVTVERARIARIDAIADPVRLKALELSLPED